jgi:hypothetical protein
LIEQAVLEAALGERLLEMMGFGTQRLDLIAGRLSGGVAGEPLVAGFEELVGPAVVEVRGDAFLAAELGDAVPAARAFQHDADHPVGPEVPPGGSPVISDGLLRARQNLLVFLSHRVPSRACDEPEILSCAIGSACPTGSHGDTGLEFRL